MPGTIANTNAERKSYLQFYYAAGLTDAMPELPEHRQGFRRQ